MLQQTDRVSLLLLPGQLTLTQPLRAAPPFDCLSPARSQHGGGLFPKLGVLAVVVEQAAAGSEAEPEPAVWVPQEGEDLSPSEDFVTLKTRGV